MNAHEIISKDIKSFVSKALHTGVLVNPKTPGDFYSNKSSIKSKYSFFSNEEDYISNYHKKYELGEYFIALCDGSYIQINYEFETKRKRDSYLKKMNLCYLPAVVDGEIKNEYIRIDYSDTTDNSFFHPYAHVHIGFKNTIRIPINEILLFSEFIKIIFYLFYPDEFKKIFPEIKTTNTIEKSVVGKATNKKVITNELESFMYLLFN